MTTMSWTATMNHSTDANFRAWGSGFSARLAMMGLIKAGDTGQIDWATVVRPTSNETSAGYEIWRYPNSYIWMRFDFGRARNLDVPQMWLRVGQGSNGAGTLTGVISLSRTILPDTTSSWDGSYSNWMCFKDNYLAFAGFRNVENTDSFFAICPTVNASGQETTVGVQIYWGSRNAGGGRFPSVEFLNFQLGFRFGSVNQDGTLAGSYCLIPHNMLSSYINGTDSQCFTHWASTPRVMPVMHICTVIDSEFPTGNIFNVALVGSTPRSYIALSNSSVDGAKTSQPGFGGSGISDNDTKIAMLWE
jgi:hypothetical protein